MSDKRWSHELPATRRPGMISVITTVALGLACVGLAACGSSGSGGGAKTHSKGSLTLAIPVSIASFANPYIAESLGLFKRYGVNVTILSNTGSNTLSYLQSNKADIAAFGATLPLIAAQEGLDTKIIFDNTAGGAFPVLIGKASTTEATIKKQKNCRIAVLAQGSSVYGFGVVFNRQLGTSCDLVPLATAQAQVAAVQGGSAIAAVVANTTAAAAASGGMHTVATATIPYYTSSVYFGVASSLASKRSAVVAFMQAMLAANSAIKSDSAAKLAALLAENSAFKGTSLAALTSQTSLLKAAINLTNGMISSGRWSYSLKQFVTWSVPNYSPSDSIFSYTDRVDMSYLSQAEGAK